MSQHKRVFLIEDDADIRDALTEILNLEGFDVRSAENGKDALDKLLVSSPIPDLILLDLMMPVMDGYEFLTERKKHPTISKLPVVILTANQAKDPLLMTEAQGFLRKPLDLGKLVPTMQGLM